jgi:hypothetical protein
MLKEEWHKDDKVKGDWRKFNDKELHNLHSSPNTIRIIKSRRMRWAEHVVRIGKMGNVYTIE